MLADLGLTSIKSVDYYFLWKKQRGESMPYGNMLSQLGLLGRILPLHALRPIDAYGDDVQAMKFLVANR